MVKIMMKFKAHGKNAKWYTENVRTIKEAQHTKKFIGNEGQVRIFSRGKEITNKRPIKRKPTSNRMFSMPMTFKPPRFRF